MKTDITVTSLEKFSKVRTVDTSDLKCTTYPHFKASGNICILLNSGEEINSTGDHGPSDFEEFGFELIPNYWE